MPAARLFTAQTTDAQSATATVSDTERTLAFWGTFATAKVHIEVQAETGVWVNFKTVTGPSVLVLDLDATWTFRLNQVKSESNTSIDAQFGPPTV